MRPLRELYASGRTPKDPAPSEPVALLWAVVRPYPGFDPAVEGDRALFGLDAEAFRGLGPRVAPLLELAWEVVEGSGVWFPRLSGLRVGCVHGGPPGVGPLERVQQILGVTGPLQTSADGPALLSSVLAAANLLRVGDVDLAIVLAEEGSTLAAVCLGRTDRASREDWRVEGLVLGGGVAADRDGAVALAEARARTPGLAGGTDTSGLLGALRSVADGAGPVLIADAVGGRAAAVVLGPAEPSSVADVAPRFLGLSARSGRSLASLADGVVGVLADPRVLGDRADVAALAMDALRRPAFEHRIALPVATGDELRARLGDWLEGIPARVAMGHVDEANAPGPVFVFPPSGVQVARSADRLYELEPTFRDALNRCDRISRPWLPRALLSVLFPTPGRDDETADPGYANPLTFAIGWSLAEMLRSFGIEPIGVMGCGVGELVAAAVAGTVDLEHALRLSVERGRLLRGLADPGRRAVLGASEEQVRSLIAGDDAVDLVAVPRPGRVVVGGESNAIDRLVDRARLRGIQAAEVEGNPLHSPLVDPIVPEFAEAASGLVFHPTDLPVYSTVTGRVLTQADPSHWVGTLRAPLRFSAAVEAAWAGGGRTFVELAARPTLGTAGEQTLDGRPGRFFPALVPGMDDRAHLDELLSALWVRGVDVKQGASTRVPSRVVLPTYRFDRRPLDEAWVDDPPEEDTETASRPGTWLAELHDDDGGDITLVPPEELVPRVDAPSDEGDLRLVTPVPAEPAPAPVPARTDELLDLRSRPTSEPLRPMFLPPQDDNDDAMSVDSDPVMDITFDDLRYTGPGRPSPVSTAAPASDDDADLIGQQGPVWTESWSDAPTPAVGRLEPTTFVLLNDQHGLGDGLAALLRAEGHRVVRVECGTEVPRDSETQFVPDPMADDAWMTVLESIGTVHDVVQIVHLWTVDEEEVSAPRGWPSLVTLVQEVLTEGLPARIHLVTSGAVLAPQPGRDVAGGLWGAAGLLASETDLFAGIVDLDPDDPDPTTLHQHLLAQCADPDAAGAFAIRAGARQRREIVPIHEPPRPEALDTSGTWILGGDVDATMLDLASWLVGRGVKRLFLVGASAPPGDVLKSALEFQKRGTACIVVRADPTDPKGTEQIRQRLSREAKLSGAFVRLQPTPCALREMSVGRDLGRWRLAMRTAELLAELVGDRAPVFAWSESRALDGMAGNAVGACIATSLAARLVRRDLGGSRSAMIHTGPHTTLPPGESVRLVTGLCALGGQWGVWLP